MLLLTFSLCILECNRTNVVNDKIGFESSTIAPHESVCYQFYKNSVLLFHTISNLEYNAELKVSSSIAQYLYPNDKNVVGFNFNDTGIFQVLNKESNNVQFAFGYTSIDSSYQYFANDAFYLRYSNENVHPIASGATYLIYYIGNPNNLSVDYQHYQSNREIFPTLSISNTTTSDIAQLDKSAKINTTGNLIMKMRFEGKHLGLTSSHDLITTISVENTNHPNVSVSGFLDNNLGGFIKSTDFSYVYIPTMTEKTKIMIISVTCSVGVLLLIIIILGIIKIKKSNKEKNIDSNTTTEALVV